MRPDLGHLVPSDDGYLFDFYMAPVPGAYPALRGKYRPVTTPLRDTWFAHIKGKKQAEVHEFLAGALATQIKSWDMVWPKGATDGEGHDIAGQSVPITADVILKVLKIVTREWLENVIIYWSQASDVDPQWDSEESDEYRRVKEEAERTGKPVAAILLEGIGKNSAAA